MNPAPDADCHSVGEFYHNWVVRAVTELVFKLLAEPQGEPRYRWDAFLNPQPESSPIQAASAVASAAEQAARTIIPKPVREIPQDIAAGVSELVGDAASTVREVFEKVADSGAPKKTATKRKAPARKSSKTREKPSSSV